MKNLNIFTIILLASTTSAMTACSDEENMGIPIPQHMTAEYVTAALDGKGWQHVESHEIKSNGTLDKQEYWSGMTGAEPSLYSFRGDTVTTYSYIDAYPISGYRKKSYTYNEGTNQLMAGGAEMFKVISLSANEMRLIKYQAMDGTGKKIYVCSTYRPMSGGELEVCMKKHPYDLDSLNEKYPTLPDQMRITDEYFSRHAVGKGWICTEAHIMEMAGRYNTDNIYCDSKPGMPDNCFIDGDTITWLPQCAGKASAHAGKMKYIYKANGFYLAPDTGCGFRIISLTDNEMRIVKTQSGDGSGKPAELYCVYRRMTSEELRLFMNET